MQKPKGLNPCFLLLVHSQLTKTEPCQGLFVSSGRSKSWIISWVSGCSSILEHIARIVRTVWDPTLRKFSETSSNKRTLPRTRVCSHRPYSRKMWRIWAALETSNCNFFLLSAWLVTQNFIGKATAPGFALNWSNWRRIAVGWCSRPAVHFEWCPWYLFLCVIFGVHSWPTFLDSPCNTPIAG